MQWRPVYTYYSRYIRLALLSAVVIAGHSNTFAQSTFYGILINTADSLPVPYAAIKSRDNELFTITDAKGIFALTTQKETIHIEVTAIGNNRIIAYKRTFADTERVYVDLSPKPLNEYTIVGLSAADVVRKAVAAIPANYTDSSYFAYSAYRRYQRINDRFVNLTEAKPVVMFRLAKTKKEITASEAYAVTNFRRTSLYNNPGKDPEPDLLAVNPVYHLAASSLAPGKLDNYYLRFDTTNKDPDKYVIDYTSNSFSSETHGISNYDPAKFSGECWEKGRLYIDRNTFAILQIERKSFRHPGYSYWGRPNMVIGTNYFVEFINADLAINYAQTNGKWHINSLTYTFTNDFYKAVWGTKDFTITDVYEWRCDSISRYIDGALVDKFYRQLPDRVYAYDKRFWDNDQFPFTLHSKDSVYADLLKKGPLEEQYARESTRTE